MEIKIIDHGSPQYEEMIFLRINVLLNPIGISSSYINKDNERNDYLLGAFEWNTLIGCCVLTPKSNKVMQLRQMAVQTELQGKNTGKAIIQYAEKIAHENGFIKMIMHARDEVIGFYQKCGYKISGEQFFEVGIPHHLMEKNLSGSKDTLKR